MRSLALVLLSACGPTIGVLPADPTPRALHATSPASVEVFEQNDPARPFVEVDALLAQNGDRPVLISAIRKRAADIGCDAVIIDSELPQSNGHTVPMTDAPAWWSRRHPGERTYVPAHAHELDASCIVYTP